tara:strand:- start:570 stop:1232 length:663 start_codon:yes stop_codon:yes gene_type:complete
MPRIAANKAYVQQSQPQPQQPQPQSQPQPQPTAIEESKQFNNLKVLNKTIENTQLDTMIEERDSKMNEINKTLNINNLQKSIVGEETDGDNNMESNNIMTQMSNIQQVMQINDQINDLTQLKNLDDDNKPTVIQTITPSQVVSSTNIQKKIDNTTKNTKFGKYMGNVQKLRNISLSLGDNLSLDKVIKHLDKRIMFLEFKKGVSYEENTMDYLNYNFFTE